MPNCSATDENRRMAEIRICAADMVRILIDLHNSGHDDFDMRQTIRNWCDLTGHMVEVIDGKMTIISLQE